MLKLAIAEAFVDGARAAQNEDDLLAALAKCCRDMGVRYFALTHHVDFSKPSFTGLRLHNYPLAWQNWFDENRLGTSDPIHRASHVSSIGFAWSAVPRMIKMTAADKSVLSQAHLVGIGDGFTVPAHVPGETNGSCSFAMDSGEAFPSDLSYLAQLIGGFSFEAARRITRVRDIWADPNPTLTDRQRECVLWAARGKTDHEISVILAISQETVIQHLKQARERYGVQKRALLAVRALFDGLISFTDILRY
jgi:LuxR family quorum-sensing system transcriptional regulator CciR